jgi:hypothetical protein
MTNEDLTDTTFLIMHIATDQQKYCMYCTSHSMYFWICELFKYFLTYFRYCSLNTPQVLKCIM